MKVCMLGDHTGNPDEGYRNVALHLSSEMSSNHEVVRISMNMGSVHHVSKLVGKFNPDVIHYLSAPSLASIGILRHLKSVSPKAKTVLSVLHSKDPRFARLGLLLFKPDIILIQSNENQDVFRRLGCEVEFLPNGVDTARFVPLSERERGRMREQLGIDTDKFVVSHIGHMKRNRNLKVLTDIHREDCQVVIVASDRRGVDRRLLRTLRKKGCVVIVGYQPNIEAILAVTDCYVFPVRKGNTLATPLSVLEAMSCNLPVVTTPFGGLRKMFEEGDGLFFATEKRHFSLRLAEVESNSCPVRTRDMVTPYLWKEIAKGLTEIYESIAG